MSTYSFTALLEADLLQGINGSSIGYGDTFIMPENATVEMIVTDNDDALSGDRYYNEYGDDKQRMMSLGCECVIRPIQKFRHKARRIECDPAKGWRSHKKGLSSRQALSSSSMCFLFYSGKCIHVSYVRIISCNSLKPRVCSKGKLRKN